MEVRGFLNTARVSVLEDWRRDIASQKSAKLSLLDETTLTGVTDEAYDGLVEYMASGEKSRLDSFVINFVEATSKYAISVGELQQGVSILRDRMIGHAIGAGDHELITVLNKGIDYVCQQIGNEAQRAHEKNVLVVAGAIIHALGNMQTPVVSGLLTIKNMWPTAEQVRDLEKTVEDIREGKQADAYGLQNLVGDIPVVTEFLDNALRNSQRLKEVADDFKQLQNLVNVRGDIRPTSIYRIARDVYGHWGTRSTEKGLTFGMDVDDIEVLANPKLLSMAFREMVGNAIKYTPEGGSVRILGENLNGFYKINIIDTGIGIPKEEIDRIWWPLYRAPEVRAKYEGTGVGLFTDKAFIEGMGGFIGVQSEEGKGSTFYFGLPTAK